LVGDGTKATFSNAVISGNVNFGVYATGAGAEVHVEASMVSANGQGLATATGAIVRVSNSTVTANGLGLNTSGGGSIFTYGQNRPRRNRLDRPPLGPGPPAAARLPSDGRGVGPAPPPPAPASAARPRAGSRGGRRSRDPRSASPPRAEAALCRAAPAAGT